MAEEHNHEDVEPTDAVDWSESMDHSNTPRESEPAEATESTVESLQQQLAEADKRVLRAEAEKENFRKRIKTDYESQLKFAALPLLQDMLQVRDNLMRALNAAGESGESAGLREGVAMVAKQLNDTLAKHHCTLIPAVGEVFDPNYHEAIQQAPSNEFAAGIVSMEVTSGYQMHDRVVRPSQVIVSTGPVPEN